MLQLSACAAHVANVASAPACVVVCLRQHFNKPLHLAAAQPGCPLELLSDVIRRDPMALRIPNGEKLLPLHIACKRGATAGAVQMLCEAHADALAEFPPVRACACVTVSPFALTCRGVLYSASPAAAAAHGVHARAADCGRDQRTG